VYSRNYDGLELNFEASGGLVNSSLVMQDKETDTYWSIMKGSATAGQLNGTQLTELPVSEKTSWADWVARHPDTKVLSVDGAEHAADGYERYWEDPAGFRGQVAADQRLDTKTAIFAFTHEGRKFAVAHTTFAGGHLVLYRAPGSAMFQSTAAFLSRAGFVQDADTWIELESGARFDAATGSFSDELVPQLGFDTFWYNWSLNNPDTDLLQ
jgi:hypothetical protein